jgi:membrane-bound lytic murein transglycosylase D
MRPLLIAAALFLVLQPWGAASAAELPGAAVPPTASSTAPVAAPAAAPPMAALDDAPEPEAVAIDAEQQQVKDLLEHDIPDSSDDLSADVDRWVLHDIVQDDFAMSRPVTGPGAVPPLPTAVLPRSPDVAETAAAADPAALQQSEALAVAPWTAAVVHARLMRRLHGEPEQHHDVDVARVGFDIPLHHHPLVDVYVDYFTGRGRWFFQTWLTRAQRFVPMMHPILERAGLPKDLVYVAMIESGFSSSAYSTAAAAGYWQFIGSTGKTFGLTHDLWVDERRDFIRATQAAAGYLGQLHRHLGDWHLAWASYNAGEGRIRRAMARTGARTFWELIGHPKIVAKETMHYVPKVIAAAMIAKDPQRYGFVNLPQLQPLTFDTLCVDDAVDLQVIARSSGISLETLRELNPALLHDITPPGRVTVVRVPQHEGPRVARLLQAVPKALRLVYHRVCVQRGDTLSGLSRRYKVDARVIKELNHLRSTRLMPGQSLVMATLPLRRGAVVPPRALARASVRQRPKVPRLHSGIGARPRRARAGSPRRHVVTPGDSLWSISRRYGVNVGQVKRSRQGRGVRLAIGDVVEIL